MKISFGSQNLFNVNIEKRNARGTYDTVPANFSLISRNSEEDLQAVYDILYNWDESDYGKTFCHSFYNNKKPNVRFYFVELIDDSKSLYEKVLCLLKSSIAKYDEKRFDVCLLQGKPDIIASKEIRGLGKAALSAVEKLAEAENADRIEVISTNNPFYLKYGYEFAYGLDNSGVLQKIPDYKKKRRNHRLHPQTALFAAQIQ